MTTTNPVRTIEVTVSPTGAVTIAARGFAGESCRDATRSLEQGLGLTASRQLSAEYSLRQQSQVARRLGEQQ